MRRAIEKILQGKMHTLNYTDGQGNQQQLEYNNPKQLLEKAAKLERESQDEVAKQSVREAIEAKSKENYFCNADLKNANFQCLDVRGLNLSNVSLVGANCMDWTFDSESHPFGNNLDESSMRLTANFVGSGTADKNGNVLKELKNGIEVNILPSIIRDSKYAIDEPQNLINKFNVNKGESISRLEKADQVKPGEYRNTYTQMAQQVASHPSASSDQKEELDRLYNPNYV